MIQNNQLFDNGISNSPVGGNIKLDCEKEFWFLESFAVDEQIIRISVLETGKFLILVLQFNFA